MDASGNRNDTLTKAIKFNSPTEKDNENNEEKILCECQNSTENKSNREVIIILTLSILSFAGLLIYRRRKKPAQNSRN